MEDLTGRQFNSYQIVAPLGEGGMAAVYKAFQPSMDRYVALKILPRQFASEELFIARFEQEAKVVAQLQHPHILPVFDYDQAEGYTYIVMPFLQSGNLTDLLTGQPLPLDQINKVISQIGDALDYAHSQGLVHRDIKPSNVMLDERGNCLLTDFGITKIVESSSKLTVTGSILGTPAYMSPEQGMDQELDGRSDIYSLGIMFYEMATGRVPFQAETPIAVVVKHMNDPLPPPRQVNPGLPESIKRVILKALSKEAQDRYATAGDMVQALQSAINELDPPEMSSMDATVPEAVVTRPQQETFIRKTNLPRKIILTTVIIAFALIVGAALVFSIGGGRSKSSYDNFNDPKYNGTINSDLWQPVVNAPSSIEQQDGKVILSLEPNVDEIISLISSSKFSSTWLHYGEANILLSSQKTGHDGDVGFALIGDDQYNNRLIYLCVIGRSSPVRTWCEANLDGESVSFYATEAIQTDYDVWHTVRIELGPEMETTFYIDGKLAGVYQIPASARDTSWIFKVRLEVWSPQMDGIEAHFDEVKVEQFEKETD